MPLLAIAQFAPGADAAVNLASIEAFAERAAARGATLLLLPEYSSYFTPEADETWLASAQHLDGEFVTGLGAIGQRLGIHLVAGFIETADATHVSNTVVAVAPAGAVAAVYRKVHLYDAFGYRESDWVTPGPIEEPQTFAWEGFTVGMQTCYDIRFPEVSRRLVDAGADLLLVPAEWVRGPLKEQHWRTLLTARALENTVYVAAADHAPPIGVGNSMVLDPMGVELVTIGDETGVAVAELDPARIRTVREVNPALALRRFGSVAL
ncbi:MAG: carbon-nitrogen hydrolase family protein [Rhodoglobus sp.]